MLAHNTGVNTVAQSLGSENIKTKVGKSLVLKFLMMMTIIVVMMMIMIGGSAGDTGCDLPGAGGPQESAGCHAALPGNEVSVLGQLHHVSHPVDLRQREDQVPGHYQ